MSSKTFLDTNVLVYALDEADPRKQRIASGLAAKAVAGESAISVQVLAEFAATLLQKYPSKFSGDQVLGILDSLKPVVLIKPDAEMVRRAVEAHATYGVHFYDGMIIAAAERGGCARILSEDLAAGQIYFGVAVENPFRAHPK
ncbi:MAG TPA: PIN domain-containing protein [Verrucomicrobiae bacterium]|jgi:predicted nucleic acid-binding protein|nr:PIN domain-containing protein [Verrucomicrobiae bacterium]